MTFPIFPVGASTRATDVDTLYFAMIGITGLIVAAVAALIGVFSYRYRRGTKVDRGRVPLTVKHEFEIAWTAATAFAFVFLFWWGASVLLADVPPPKGALEIHVYAKQWMWKTQHPNGAREIDELHVPLGEPVRLVMTSQDVIHSFYIPAFRIKRDVLPERYTQVWFTATKLGVYHLFCAEYCGTDHSRMQGRIVVMRPEDYARWAAAQPEADTLAREGAALFTSLGCSGCHAPSSRVHAPDLSGVYGRLVHLSDGRVVKADEAYLRDSILQPGRDVVAGYDPIMPSFKGAVSEGQLQALIAYLESLGISDGTKP